MISKVCLPPALLPFQIRLILFYFISQISGGGGPEGCTPGVCGSCVHPCRASLPFGPVQYDGVSSAALPHIVLDSLRQPQRRDPAGLPPSALQVPQPRRGGGQGVTNAGTALALEEAGLLEGLQGFAGTSSGSQAAALLSAGFTGR